MTNPTPTAPTTGSPAPAAPSAPGASAKPVMATLSRELADFLVELSITLNKHAIYPSGHPLLDVAVDGVANRVGALFVGDRDSLSIGVARRQLIIEGVATDPLNPVLKELAQRLHEHHVGAVKFIRGLDRNELAQALAALAVHPPHDAFGFAEAVAYRDSVPAAPGGKSRGAGPAMPKSVGGLARQAQANGRNRPRNPRTA